MKNIRGFSLIELLVSVSILSILAGIGSNYLLITLKGISVTEAKIEKMELRNYICEKLSKSSVCESVMDNLESSELGLKNKKYGKHLVIDKIEKTTTTTTTTTTPSTLKIKVKMNILDNVCINFDANDGDACYIETFNIEDATDENNCRAIDCAVGSTRSVASDPPADPPADPPKDCGTTEISNCQLSSADEGNHDGNCVNGKIGTCRYECFGTSWWEIPGQNKCVTPTPPQSCNTHTTGGCKRSGRSHGGSSGSCISGYTGSCSYTCNDGSWSGSNNCNRTVTYSSCNTHTRTGCKRYSRGHGGSSGSCISGYTGSCSYTCNNGSWGSPSSNNCNRTVTYRSCDTHTTGGCKRSGRSHGGSSGSCINSYTGSCSYTCNNGSWGSPSSNNCKASLPPPPPVNQGCSSAVKTKITANFGGCTKKLALKCNLPASGHSQIIDGTCSFSNHTGTCGVGYYNASGSCRYQCYDGGWTKLSNSCGVSDPNDYSDKRLKTNIKELSRPLDKLNKLNAYSFHWNKKSLKQTDKKHIGFIAQEVKTVIPELVEKDRAGFFTIRYTEIIPLVVSALKEFQQLVSENFKKLKQSLSSQQDEIKALKKELKATQLRLHALEKKQYEKTAK